ncbi:hypothetical protein JCM5353_000615 [Sporobolomyces roseus]
MEFPSILDLERLSLVDSNTLSPLPSPDSSHHAPTLCSLPPELLNHIFQSFPKAVALSEYQKPLARLCLVNRYFLEIARPLLYQHIRCSILQRHYLTESEEDQGPIRTLLSSRDCAKLVKSLTITDCRPTQPSREDLISFAYLLSHLSKVKEIKVPRRQSTVDPAVNEDFLEAIRKHCADIERLRMPKIPIGDSVGSEDIFKSSLSSLLRLESYDGIVPLVSPISSSKPPPQFHLHQLVATSIINQHTLQWITQHSLDSLTSLTFLLHATPRLTINDLSPLRNLATLCIFLDYDIVPLDYNKICDPRSPFMDPSLATLVATTSKLPLRKFCCIMPLVVDNAIYYATHSKEGDSTNGDGKPWPGMNPDGPFDVILRRATALFERAGEVEEEDDGEGDGEELEESEEEFGGRG